MMCIPDHVLLAHSDLLELGAIALVCLEGILLHQNLSCRRPRNSIAYMKLVCGFGGHGAARSTSLQQCS